jgi:PAS domain S-box-containing protein
MSRIDTAFTAKTVDLDAEERCATRKADRTVEHTDDVFTPDAAFDVVSDWIALIDADCTVRRANAAMAAAFNVTPDDLVGKKCFHLVHGTDGPIVNCPHMRLVNDSGEPTDERVEIEGHGVFDVSCTPLRDAAGALIGSVHMAHDVTERQQREAERLRAEALTRGLFDTMPSGSAIYEVRGEGRSGADYIVKDFNRAALAIEGLSKADVVGKSLKDLRPTIDDYGLIDVFRRVWHTGDPERYPAKYYVDDHYEAWYDNHVFKLSTGEIVSIYDDVTAENEAGEALRESEAELHAIFELVGIPLVVMDTQARFLRWNRAFQQATGYTPQELKDIGLRDLTPPEDHGDMLRRVSGALRRGGSSYRIQRPFIAKGGTRYWFDISLTPVKGADGEAVALIAGGTDVTETLRARDAVTASEERLRTALNETVAAMGAIVALRDPYTAGHEQRVTELAEAIAVDMKCSADFIDGLCQAASVHDVGKVAVPAEILAMPRRLTEWELNLVQTHVDIGHQVLTSIGFEQPVAEIVWQHHERLDGSGYPRGLKGDAILPQARILAVADVVEAMASHRPYRPAPGIGAALDEIRWGAGRLYDSDVVASCARVVRRGVVDLSATQG